MYALRLNGCYKFNIKEFIMEKWEEVKQACVQNLVGANIHACNKFVRDMVAALGGNTDNFLDTIANTQVTLLRLSADWENLGQGAAAGLARANAGNIVIAGWINTGGHGHVAIAVKGDAVNGWPRGYWGQLGGTAGYNLGLRNSFGADKRATTQFFSREF
jgi:hypothetical protein